MGRCNNLHEDKDRKPRNKSAKTNRENLDYINSNFSHLCAYEIKNNTPKKITLGYRIRIDVIDPHSYLTEDLAINAQVLLYILIKR